MAAPDDVLMVWVNVPDDATAQQLAQALVGDGLAACVNQLAPCRSVYRWDGAIEAATEVPLVIKTTRAACPALIDAITARHPYDVPEILALPVSAGLPAYLQWVAGSCPGR